MGNNISVPYSGYIQGGVTVGTDVLISGSTHHDFKKFSINLCAGPTFDTSDAALHFNPRFDQGQVVRNHKQGGSWGIEETSGGMPFRRGHTFEFHMKVDQQGYKVTINNRHFCNFHHRIPKERVQYLFIDGDVTINFIQFRGQGGNMASGKGGYLKQQRSKQRLRSLDTEYPTGNIAPPPYPGLPSYPSYPGAVSFPAAVSYPSYPLPPGGPLYNPPVPLTTPIQGGMYSGKIIYISGIPKHNPSRFSVNLTCGPHDSADIGLHFDVRFNFGSCHNVVVRTHRQGGSYGPEDKHQNYFPFFPGVNFELMILAEQGSYKIAVNNQHFVEFYHRIHPLQRVDYLNIVGDVQLTQVRFQ